MCDNVFMSGAKFVVGVKQFSLTPSIKTYIEEKLGGLERLVKQFKSGGEAEFKVELSRLTRHHEHGDVFGAVLCIQIGKKMVCAEAKADDLRQAIDVAKNKLRVELEKHKERFLGTRRKLRNV